MVYRLATFMLAPLLVFGMYHLLTWFNVFRINERATWARVAIASAISHVLLATGFLGFSYFQFKSSVSLGGAETAYGPYLFNQPEFWRLMMIFDTAAMLAVLGFSSALDRAGINPPGLLAVTFAITYAIGTLQWFLIGGAIGGLLERFWAGLKTGDEEDEEWL